MGNKLDDELDQILKNTSFNISDSLDESKTNSTSNSQLSRITFKYLIPITCLLLSFFILQIFFPTNFINKVFFWGTFILFIMLLSIYLLDSKPSQYQPKWRGRPVVNLQKNGIVNKFRDFFKS
jgi:RsiW-degrading membrane proteinase PrsW (M82 family)